MSTEKLLAQLGALQYLAPDLLEACKIIAEKAQEYAPVDTGYLQEHIKATGKKGGGSVISEADYSVYQEFGTYKMPAHPFLRPAVDSTRKEFLAKVAKIVEADVRKAVK